MIQERPARVGQRDAARAADEQLRADLMLEIADLTAERWLGRMQTLFRRDRKAALLGDGDEIAKMPQFHVSGKRRQTMPARYGAKPTKSFSTAQWGPRSSTVRAMEARWKL